MFNKFKELNKIQKGRILGVFFVIVLGISTTVVLVSNRQKQIRYQPKASSDTPDSQCSLIFDVQDEPTPTVGPTLIPTSSPTLTLTSTPTTIILPPTPAFSCQERCGILVGRCGTPVPSTTFTIACSVSVTYPGNTVNDCTSTCYCSLCSQPMKTPIPKPTLSTDKNR